jgi:hypothetical protein
MIKKYYIYHHLGLGDHIILNGLIRNLIKDDGLYFLFCKKHNVKNVEFMYRDIKNLRLISIDTDTDVINFLNKNKINNLIKIGHDNLEFFKRFYSCTWDEAFYRQMNVDFEERWNSFYYERDIKSENILYELLNPTNDKFVLIHNIDSTGTDRIDYTKINLPYKKIFVEKPHAIFDFGKLVDMAEEIHCVDSSFKHIVDSIPTKGQLFYHKYYNAKHGESENHQHKKNWIIV